MTPTELSTRLHDGPLQALTAARLHLDTITAQRDTVPAELLPLVIAAHEAVVAASSQCRALVDELTD